MKPSFKLFLLTILAIVTNSVLCQNSYFTRAQLNDLDTKTQIQKWIYDNNKFVLNWTSNYGNFKTFGLGDTDNDGVEEMIYVYEDRFEVVDAVEATPVITQYPTRIKISGVYVIDLDKDSKNEVIICPNIMQHKIYLYKYNDGKYDLISQVNTDLTFHWTIGDADSDGFYELICGGQNQIRILSYTDKNIGIVFKESISAAGINTIDMAIAGDVDNDGKNEVIGGGNSKKAFIWDYDNKGNKLIGTYSLSALSQSVNVADVNGDGLNELLVGTANGNGNGLLEILKFANGTFQSLWKIGLGLSVQIGTIKIVDYNNDGIKDIYVSGMSSERYKARIYSYNLVAKQFDEIAYINSSPFGEFIKSNFSAMPEWKPKIVVTDFSEVKDGDNYNLFLTIQNLGKPTSNLKIKLDGADKQSAMISNIYNIGLLGFDEVCTNSTKPFIYKYQPAPEAEGHKFIMTISQEGLPDFVEDYLVYTRGAKTLNHTTGNVSLSIGNDGEIGSGLGFTYLSNKNALAWGGVMIGNMEKGMRGISYDDQDMTNQGGLFGFTSDKVFNQISETRYTDKYCQSPYNVMIIQKVYSINQTNYFLVDYQVVNNSKATINSLYCGMLLDWDIGTYNTNNGGVLHEEKLAYQYDKGSSSTDKNYYGVAVLSKYGGGNVSSEGDFTPGKFYNFMTNNLPVTVSNNADVRSFVSSGPFNLKPGESIQSGFAVLAGGTLEDLKKSASDAKMKWQSNVATDINKGSFLANMPETFQLYNNYPNPFNPQTTISYRLPRSVKVSLKIFNVLGKEVETLVTGEQAIGNYSVTFDGSKLSSGVYFYQLRAGDYIQTRKLLLMK